MRRTLTFVSIGLFLLSCSKDDSPVASISNADYLTLSKTLDIPEVPIRYSHFDVNPEIKSYFVEIQDNTPEDNPVTDWGATLGRVLFYDEILSKNNTVACASCHIQSHGFSDDKKLSEGFNGGLTKRHSMGLSNARYYTTGRFFWDTRAATLEDQVLMPIQDQVEMGMTIPEVLQRLEQTDYYPILFKNAFGDNGITEDRLSKALAQFVRSIVSSNSKFDEGLIAADGDPHKPFPNFSPAENQGKHIFYLNTDVNCAGCHSHNLMTTDVPRNNGTIDGDLGAYEVEPRPQFKGAFKAPSLRNIGVRPPYMHNGSMNTLEEVVEHYNSGLTNADGNLDFHLVRNDTAVQMNLTEMEKKALVDFLHTLTDSDFLSNPVFSDPFRK